MSTIKICPDCKGVLSWNTHFKAYTHSPSSKCAYMEDANGNRIWDNARRDEQLKNGTYPKRIRILEADREC